MRRWWLDLGSFALALALAAAVVLRWRRGQVTLLSSGAAPAIRLLALLVVFVQGCADRLRGREEPSGHGAPGDGQGSELSDGAGSKGQGEQGMSNGTRPSQHVRKDSYEVPPGGDFPLADEAAVVRCVRLLTEEEWGPSDAKRLVLALAAVPEGTAAEDPAWQHAAQLVEAVARRAGGEASREFRERWLAHVEARRAGRAQTIAELEALLAAAEALPVYHVGLAGYLWRRAAPVPATATARAQLLGRLELHLRAATALVKGQFEVGPIEFTAWRSKAAPPPGWSGVRVPPGILAAAQRHFASGDAGTWATEATLELAVVGEGVTLLRAGQAVPLAPGGALTLRRLDVLQAARPATLRHAELGDMSLGAGAVVTAWDVGERLPEAGRARVRALVTAAGKGEAQALKQLESILPAAHAEIRRAVAERPGAPGSAGLRTLLTLFDE